MTHKKLATVLGLGIGALALTFAAGLLFQLQIRSGGATEVLAPGFKADQASRVTIKAGGTEYALAKKEGAWFIDSPDLPVPVRTNLVEDLLAWMEKARSLRLVSADGQGADALGFGPESRSLGFAGAAGQDLGTLVLGKQSETGSEAYVRFGSSMAIQAVDQAIMSLAARSMADWADKRLWPGASEAEVTAFTVREGSVTERFQRASDAKAWSGTGSAVAEKSTAAEILPLLRQILTLEGSGMELIAADKAAARFEGLSRRFSLSLEAGSTLALDLWQSPDQPEGDYVVDFGGSRQSADGRVIVLTMPSWKVGDLKVRLASGPAQNP